jgi:hypothetical protein
MSSSTQGLPAGGYIATECPPKTLSRETKTLISGQNLGAGTVLGAITIGAVTAAAKGGGNTGNGTCTPDATTPALAKAQVGIYTARCIVAGTNSATFRVTDPNGNVLGDANFSGSGASLAFANQIKFAITDGGTDFIVGDGFDITVAAGSGKVTQLAPAALDGSQNAVGILFYPTDARSGDKPAVITSRLTEVISSEITWPAGITAPQQAVATAQLAALAILLR